LRGDAAAGHQLDLVGALADFVAYRLAHLGHAVGDAAEAEAGEMRRAFAGLELVGGRARVAVAAGLADGSARHEQTRAPEQPAFDGLAMPGIGAARVAHGRETPHQHAVQGRQRVRGDQRR